MKTWKYKLKVFAGAFAVADVINERNFFESNLQTIFKIDEPFL